MMAMRSSRIFSREWSWAVFMSVSLLMTLSRLRFAAQNCLIHKRRPSIGDRRKTLAKTIELLLSRSRFSRRSTNHLGGIENRVRSQMRRLGREQLLFAINQIRRVKGRQLKSVSVRNRVRRASFNAVSAENAAVVIDVVDLGVTLCAADAV